MPIENGRPVIFLAFANMEGDLPELRAEIRQLQELFEAFQGEGRCTLVFKPNATLEQIFNILTEQLNRIAIFHYGGHADGGRLMLESALGRAPAYGQGLATLLGQQRGLRLAFLNGCSTRPQVQRLLDAGVPAVVATARAIDDRVAREFAVAFYTALTKGGDSIRGGQNLHGALEAAKGFAIARGGSQARGLLTRDLGGDDVADALGFPWDLIDRPGAEQVQRWNLFDDDPLFGLPSLPPGGLPTEGPFRHLDWFTAEHAEVFFGRGHQIRELYELVIGSGTPPVILLYGQSGVGKSSLLDAGLVPRLKATHEVRYRRRDAKMGLIETLRGALGSADAGRSIGAAWQDEEARLGKPLVVILDQVEEALIGGDSSTNGFGAFVEAVRIAFDDTSSTPKGKLVLGFRKEWLAEIEKGFSEARMRRAPMYLEPLDRRGVIEAVRGPGALVAQDGRRVERPVLSPRLSRGYGLEVEEDLPDLIADDLLSDPGSPVAPTLQILLSKMWDQARKQDRAHPRFDRALYEQMKREGILLSDFLDQQFDRLRAWRPEAVDSGLALDLLTFYTTRLGTSRQQTVADLFQAYGHIDSRELCQLLQQCKDRYLLVDPAGHDGDRELSEIRLAHDTLAPLVREQFDKSNYLGQRARRIVENRAVGWENKKEGTPLDELDLTIVEQGKMGTRAWTPAERRLVEASRRERERRKRNRSFLRAGLGVAILGLLYTAIVVYFDLKKTLEKQYQDQADLMLDTALAIREYTSEEIVPVLPFELPDRTASQGGLREVDHAKFHVQSIPAHAANKVFKHLRELRNKKQGDHVYNADFYKEFSDNPTNKNDLCGEFELELIREFRMNREKPHVFREHTVNGTSYMVLAKPMICEKSCLACHNSPDTPEAKAMLASYPGVFRRDQGFGWKEGDILATRVVRVPRAQVIESGNAKFYRLLVIVATFVSLNVALIRLITLPVSRLSGLVQRKWDKRGSS